MVSAHVTPWLWIISLGGFAMALMNRYQIADAVGGTMFGSFSKLRQALREKRAAS